MKIRKKRIKRMKRDAYEAEEKYLPEHQEGNTIMKYYLTQAGFEFIQEAHDTSSVSHKGGGDAYDDIKRANTGGGQQSGEKPSSMPGDFAPMHGSPDARVAQKKKKKKG